MTDLFDRFAVNLEMWWTDLSRLDRVRAAAAAGFRLAEIWFWRAWDIDRLAQVCEKEGIELTQLGGWDFEPRMNDAENRRMFREGIAAAVDVAHTLGAPRVNLNGPYVREAEDPAVVRSGVVDALGAVVDLVEGTDVTLMLEPMNLRVDHPGYSMPTSADVLKVCDLIGSQSIGINWDFYHLQISEGDLSGHLAEGVDHVAYVQFADHPGRHEPGTGEIDYRFILQRLDGLGYHGPIGLECFPRLGESDAVIRLSALFASKS